MSKSESKSERIRKARSVNDILSVVKDIAFAVSGVRSNIGRIESTSAVKQPKAVIIDHTAELGKSAKKVSTEPMATKLDKFKMPNVNTISKHVKTLHLLHESANDIDAIIASLEHTFAHAKSRGAALRSATAVQKETHKAYGEVASALNAIAKRHVPEQLREFATTIQEQLINLLEHDKYSDIGLELYVNADAMEKTSSGTTLATVEFCYYVVIHDLILDDDEDKSQPISEYCIVLTGAVKNDAIRYFLNAVPEFLPPGKYPIGKEIHTLKELNARLKLLLSVHKIVGDLEQRPMPHEKDSPKVKSIAGFPNVKSVDIKEDSLIVNMITDKDGRGNPRDSEKNCQEVVERVIPLLTPITGTRKSSPVRAQYEIVRSKQRKNGTKIIPRKTYIKFILIGKSVRRGDHADLAATKHQLEDLQHGLSLTDKEVSEIKKVLIRHRG